MKIKLLLCLCLPLLVAGCASTGSWDHQIGKLTYEQAVAELGEPMGDLKRNDGTREVTWLTVRGSQGTTIPQRGDPAYHASATPSLRAEFPARPDEYVHLTFGADGLLKAWSDDRRPIR